MTPFISFCSYMSLCSLAILLFLLVLYRVWRIQGKDNRGIGLAIILCLFLLILGVALIAIFYR